MTVLLYQGKRIEDTNRYDFGVPSHINTSGMAFTGTITEFIDMVQVQYSNIVSIETSLNVYDVPSEGPFKKKDYNGCVIVFELKDTE